jgi:hypothetical protein
MKLLLKFFASVLFALALGVGSALWAINAPPGENYTVTNGAWRTNLAIGSSQAGMYIRALVARTGLFALNKSETIYFVSDTYWSISFYQTNTDNFYVLNDRQAKSNPVDIVLVGPDMAVPRVLNTQVVVAPTNKGVFLLRSLIEDEDKLGDLIKVQKAAVCRTL